MSLEQIKSDREKKLSAWQSAGVEVYPIKTGARQTVSSVLADFEKLESGKEKVSVAGRLRALRKHGGSAFADLEDETGKFQLLFKKDELGEAFDKFLDLFDTGDFLRAEGEVFKTQKGERTLLVKDFKILAKALNQLPEKWHGLKDVEERFRRRYLDLLMNGEVKERFKKRGEILNKLRRFLEGEGFLEVETPVLQSLPGGALAKPFQTHLNALDMDLYLRVSPELYLKRLLVGGFEKVYEMGRCFRNEGMDKSHNPDFTILEFYWAFADEEMLMDLTEKMFRFLAPEKEIEFQGQKISLATPFRRVKMKDLLKEEFGVDIFEASPGDLEEIIKKAGGKVEKDSKKCKLIDELFKILRPKIIQPTFVTGHPIRMSPLAKASKENPKETARFQMLCGGMEMVNAYSELNDPREQEKRMRQQEENRDDDEIQRFDLDYIEALEYGMPPAAGFGLGIDRLIMLLTDAANVREVILFPTMRDKS